MAIRIGTNGANTISGTNQSDIVFAFGGDDLISTGAGNDWVFAGAGNDQIFAGDGNDWVFAGTGNDVASGGNGNDFLYGEAGNDVLDGGRGSDIVDGGSGSDTLIFTDAERGGLDRYIGGSGQDSLVLEFAAGRWADAAVKAEVIAYLDFLAAGGAGNFTFTTMNLIVSSVEALVVKVDGIIIDPRAGGNTAPTGVADSYSTGENGILTVSPATERGTLVDNDNTGTGAFTVELVTGPADGALTLNADGTFSFNPGAAFDYLNAGQSAIETFTYRIINNAGASGPIAVTLNITGANDAAAITGNLSGAMKEDSVEEDNETYILTTSGQINVADADAGQAGVGNAGTYEGDYGTLVLASDGSWEYTLNNSSPAVQSLGEGVTVTDSFEVTSIDGSATQSISITVEGTNDYPSLYGEMTGTVNEDGSTETNEAGTLTATGQIIVFDDDTGESGVAGADDHRSLYGTLAVAEDGSWTYTLDSNLAEIQALRGGEIVVDAIIVPTVDGTGATVAIIIEGENDAAFVDGIFSDTITLAFEDTSAEGFVTVSDVDTGESGVVAGTYAGLYGDLTMDADGLWIYQITNFDLPFDEATTSVYEGFAVETLGGDVFSIDITIQQDGFILG